MIAYCEASCHYPNGHDRPGFTQYAYCLGSITQLSPIFMGRSQPAEFMAVIEVFIRHPETTRIVTDRYPEILGVLRRVIKTGLFRNKGYDTLLKAYSLTGIDDLRNLAKKISSIRTGEDKRHHRSLHALLYSSGRENLTTWQQEFNRRKLELAHEAERLKEMKETLLYGYEQENFTGLDFDRGRGNETKPMDWRIKLQLSQTGT